MGNMECVPGMTYYDPKSIVRLYHTFHNFIVYPGEIIPIIFSTEPGAAEEFGAEPIALVFAERTNVMGYGVTCQVIEKRVSSDHKIRSKIRVLQRFKVVTKLPFYHNSMVLLPHFSTDYQKAYINVEILPEFQLGSPLYSVDAFSMRRWETNNSLIKRIKTHKSMTQAWPSFVYNLYDVNRIMMKIQYFSVELGIGERIEWRSSVEFMVIFRVIPYRQHATESPPVLILVRAQFTSG